MFGVLLIIFFIVSIPIMILMASTTNTKPSDDDVLDEILQEIDDEYIDDEDFDKEELEELIDEYDLDIDIEDLLVDEGLDEYERAGILTGQYCYIDCNESCIENRSGYERYPIKGLQFRRIKLTDIGCFEGYAKAEKDNKYDDYAIALYREDNKHIGYLPASNRQLHQYILENGGCVHCVGCIMAKHTKRNRFYGEVIVECDKTQVEVRNKSGEVDKYYIREENWLKEFLDKTQI